MQGCGLQTPVRALNSLGNEEHLRLTSYYIERIYVTTNLNWCCSLEIYAAIASVGLHSCASSFKQQNGATNALHTPWEQKSNMSDHHEKLADKGKEGLYLAAWSSDKSYLCNDGL